MSRSAEAERLAARAYRASEKGKAKRRDWYRKPETKIKILAYTKTYYAKARQTLGWKERVAARALRYYHKYRAAALAAYGNKCACCGETEPAFLSFDHINGGGEKERQAGVQGTTLYRRLAKDHRPDVQILCHNCNQARGFYGVCPHEERRSKIK